MKFFTLKLEEKLDKHIVVKFDILTANPIVTVSKLMALIRPLHGPYYPGTCGRRNEKKLRREKILIAMSHVSFQARGPL